MSLQDPTTAEGAIEECLDEINDFVTTLDRYPPTTLGAFNDNYDTSLYSIRNRYYYVSLKKKF